MTTQTHNPRVVFKVQNRQFDRSVGDINWELLREDIEQALQILLKHETYGEIEFWYICSQCNRQKCMFTLQAGRNPKTHGKPTAASQAEDAREAEKYINLMAKSTVAKIKDIIYPPNIVVRMLRAFLHLLGGFNG